MSIPIEIMCVTVPWSSVRHVFSQRMRRGAPWRDSQWFSCVLGKAPAWRSATAARTSSTSSGGIRTSQIGPPMTSAAL